jgi:hypothetical protein
MKFFLLLTILFSFSFAMYPATTDVNVVYGTWYNFVPDLPTGPVSGPAVRLDGVGISLVPGAQSRGYGNYGISILFPQSMFDGLSHSLSLIINNVEYVWTLYTTKYNSIEKKHPISIKGRGFTYHDVLGRPISTGSPQVIFEKNGKKILALQNGR